LLTVGDSWPAGAELHDKSCAFPALISEQLELESVNLAEQATSADQALYQLLNATLNNEVLVLFCLTGISRSMTINRKPRELHPTASTPASVAYYKYIHSNELDQFNRIRNIMAAQQFCQAQGSRVLFVNNWDKTPKHSAIDQTLFYNKTLVEILNIAHRMDDTDLDWYNLSTHEYISPNKCHPNISGHSIIADELSSWLKEKINDKPV
jgi:lysophospholipase L1-like esterase